MSDISSRIINANPDEGVMVYWAGGAGFIIKSKDITFGMDLYLSDACRSKEDSFKRLVPNPFSAEEIELDYLIATHDHGDHLDMGSIIKFINSNTKTKLIGPGSSLKLAQKMGIDESRLIRLDRENSLILKGLEIKAVFADHGIQSPDAIGVVINLEGKCIYYTGDTCYRVDFNELIQFDRKIDLLIVPINGKYGNPDSKDAAYIAEWVKPETVIPCHYWLFKEHGGDPGTFVEYCKEIARNVKVKVPSIGEELRI